MPTAISLFSCVLANLVASMFMTGVIWFVQIVHYPLFGAVSSEGFSAFEQRHANRTGYLVAPPMLFELGTAFLLLWMTRSTPYFVLAAWCLVLVLAAWASTFFLQVPCHDRLSRGFSPETHRRLVSTNWIRTAAWSLRSVLLLMFLRNLVRG